MPPENRGVFEISKEDFSQKTKNQTGGAIEELDLGKALPAYFSGTGKIPSSMEKLWRIIMDKTLKSSGGGHYCHMQGTTIALYFEKIPQTAAKLKIDASIKEMEKLIQQGAHKNPDTLNSAVGTSQTKTREKTGADSELSRVIHEGLQTDPSTRELRIWLDRQTQEMMIPKEKDYITPDLIEHTKKLGILYSPIWNSKVQTIVGNFMTPASAKHFTGETRSLRIDLSCLIQACLEAQRLLKAHTQVMTLCPINLKSLQDKSMLDLFTNILRNMNAGVHELLYLELKGLPGGNLSMDTTTALKTLSPYCKGFLMNTGVLKTEEYTFNNDKPHAYGFDIKDYGLPENSELYEKMTRYTGFYNPKKAKTFARNLATKSMVKKSIELGITYISGPAIVPFQKVSMPLRPLPKARLVA